MKGPWKISVFVAKCIKTASFPCSLFNYPTLRTCPHQCLFIWNEYICAFWPCFQTKAIKSPNVVAYHARHVVRGKNENTAGAVDASAVWSKRVWEKPGSRDISGDRRFWWLSAKNQHAEMHVRESKTGWCGNDLNQKPTCGDIIILQISPELKAKLSLIYL